MFVAVGLVILLTVLGVQILNSSHNQGTAVSGQPAMATGGSINESDNGTWLAEYESDGINGAAGVSTAHLLPGKALLPALLLILTGILAVGIEMRQSKPSDGG